MFREALLESSPALRRRSPWPMATAFTLQLIIAGALILVPLISSGILPLTAHLAPPPQYVPIDPVKPVPVTATSSTRTAVNAPRFEVVQLAKSTGGSKPAITYPPPVYCSNDCEPGPTLIIPGELRIGANIPVLVTHPPASAKPFITSHSLEVLLLKSVIPEYPTVARLSGVQGDVKLHAIIAKDGTIQSLTVTSGPALLQGAALKAVQQWRYRPYMLNDVPVEVETVITVSFKRS